MLCSELCVIGSVGIHASVVSTRSPQDYIHRSPPHFGAVTSRIRFTTHLIHHKEVVVPWHIE